MIFVYTDQIDNDAVYYPLLHTLLQFLLIFTIQDVLFCIWTLQTKHPNIGSCLWCFMKSSAQSVFTVPVSSFKSHLKFLLDKGSSINRNQNSCSIKDNGL